MCVVQMNVVVTVEGGKQTGFERRRVLVKEEHEGTLWRHFAASEGRDGSLGYDVTQPQFHDLAPNPPATEHDFGRRSGQIM